MNMQLQIGPCTLHEDSSPVFVGEIGTSHSGDIIKALELIDALKDAGAHAAKFQYVIADEIIHPNTGIVELPGGPTPLYDVFKSLERGIDFYAELKEYCEKIGICFLCTPFGITSARALHSLNIDAYKIASPELNHVQLLKEIDSYRAPVILSTGVSLLADIEAALGLLSKKPVLLHCVTSYPAPEEEYNLLLIQNLSRIFGCFSGVSDHSRHPYLIPSLSAVFGAKIIEKHVTLSNDTDGLDDPIALTPREFSSMIINTESYAAGTPEDAIGALKEEFGDDKIDRIIGSGIKALSPSEKDNYGRTNRSVHALTDLKKGDLLSEKNAGILRTEKVLSPGMSPFLFEQILGAAVQRDIPSGEGISVRDLLLRN